MTSLSSLHTHAATTPPPDGRQKHVLFCPVCGHESPIDGDWLVESTDDTQRLRCPECQNTLGRHDEQ